MRRVYIAHPYGGRMLDEAVAFSQTRVFARDNLRRFLSLDALGHDEGALP